MEYRLLKDKNKFYPQMRKKFQIRWRYYSSPPHVDKLFANSVSEAVDIIEENKKDSEDMCDNIWKRIIIGVGISIIIGTILFYLKTTGMI